ncbi:hypothetical protein ACSQIW_005203, partial [Escherichia coli]
SELSVNINTVLASRLPYKQNTYFSSLDNMVAQGNVLPVLYGEMRVGSRVISQEVSTRDEGNEGQMVVIGRQVNNSRHM